MKTGHQQILTKENFVESIINKGMDFEKNDISNIVNANIKAGAGILISKLESVACSVNSGSYTGNNTANRAIPHGLGVSPKYVMLNIGGGGTVGQIMVPGHILFTNATVENDATVTAVDTTNFYVGNIGSWTYSFNNGAHTIYWTAWS